MGGKTDPTLCGQLPKHGPYQCSSRLALAHADVISRSSSSSSSMLGVEHAKLDALSLPFEGSFLANLLLPLVVILVLAFLNPWTTHRRKDQHTISLNLFTIYARLLVTVLIVVLLICDNFRQRFHLLSLLHTIPGSAFTGRTGSQFSVKKLQLVILLICNVLSISEALHKIYLSRQYSYSLGVFSGVLVEHYILLNLLLCQLLAETLSNAYATLQHSLRMRPFHAIISELTVLDGCKNHLSEVIGLKLILVILHLMFNVSFCTYDILEHVLSEKHLRDITRLSIIAVQETVMLFGLCFQFTMLDRKVGYSIPPNGFNY
uniref:Gustatory receptor n=1 Tax=Anopheles quadriannulatus TaxID=34691 RepID=A0A182XP93_ANOQN